jgi:hypothetical protein
MKLFLSSILVCGVYLLTACPTVYLGDSGELTAAAFSIGIPHNSGYPIYVLLGKLFCLIPFGTIGFRVNLMSCFFGAGTVCLAYSLTWRMTGSNTGALAGSLVVAFTPIIWLQTVSAEVYTLHAFFVVLLFRLLWWWDEKRELNRILVLAMLAGLSFGNHMQTVMLAPGVFFIILSGDKKSLLSPKHLGLITLFFVLPLFIYLALPIRTWADAAIHWGDPDSFDRFIAHVTGRSHRNAYFFNKTVWEYLSRVKEGVGFIGAQFAVLTIFAVWGWLRLSDRRWKVFFVVVVFFDFFYTVFLNIISLEITPFNLTTAIVFSILIGGAIADITKRIEYQASVRRRVKQFGKFSFVAAPLLLLFLNFGICNQSRNYTAYEQAVNVFRTTGFGDILFVNGDNFVFPVAYARIAERMREDVTLYDRLDIIFRMPSLFYQRRPRTMARDEDRNQTEKSIIEQAENRQVYYGVFGPYSIEMPEKNILIPYGVIHRVTKEGAQSEFSQRGKVWKYYSTESFLESFEKDFMNREMFAFYHFSHGMYLVLSGHPEKGLRSLRLAAEIGYNDTLIHSEMAVFFTDQGFLEEARQALEKAMVHNEDLSGVYNNWGYYYHRKGDYQQAAASFEKAAELKPDRFAYYNNLGYAFYELGDRKASEQAFRKSLAIHGNQPDVEKFMKENILQGE